MAKNQQQNTDPLLENRIRELCNAEIDERVSQFKSTWITWRRGLFVGLSLVVVIFPAVYFSQQEFVMRTHNELWGSASVDDVKAIINSGEIESTYQAKIILNSKAIDQEKDFIFFKAKPEQEVKIYLKTFHSNNQDKETYSIRVNDKADSTIKDGLSTLSIKNTKAVQIVEHIEDKDIHTVGFDLNDFGNYQRSNDIITIKCIIFVYGKI